MDVETLRKKLKTLSCPLGSECKACTIIPTTDQSQSKDYLDGLPVAAVLVPIQFSKVTQQWRIILTLRQLDMRHQGGDVCFPGGMSDPDDESIVHTALREAEEEIGLSKADVEVILCMPPIISKFRIRVYPVIAVVLSDINLTANPSEVAEILYVDIHLDRDRLCGDFHRGVWLHHCGHCYFCDYYDVEYNRRMYTIYGLTSFILTAIFYSLRNKNHDLQCTVCCAGWKNLTYYGGIVEILHRLALSFKHDGQTGGFSPTTIPRHVYCDSEPSYSRMNNCAITSKL